MTLRGDLKAIRELAPNVYEKIEWKLPAKTPEEIHDLAERLKRLNAEIGEGPDVAEDELRV
jgi:hypothetical protein